VADGDSTNSLVEAKAEWVGPENVAIQIWILDSIRRAPRLREDLCIAVAAVNPGTCLCITPGQLGQWRAENTMPQRADAQAVVDVVVGYLEVCFIETAEL